MPQRNNPKDSTAPTPRKPKSPPTRQLLRQVCEDIAEGLTITQAAANIGRTKGAVCKALTRSTATRALYLQARAIRAHLLADEILDLCAKAEVGELDHNVARVTIDARKWIASRLLPGDYGGPGASRYDGRPQSGTQINLVLAVPDSPRLSASASVTLPQSRPRLLPDGDGGSGGDGDDDTSTG